MEKDKQGKKIKQRRRKQRKMSETPGLKSHLLLMPPHPPAEGNTVVFLQVHSPGPSTVCVNVHL